MFGLFKNNKPKLTITEEDKNWVETNLLWLGERYGIGRVLKNPFIYPYYEEFPYKNLRKEEEYAPFFAKLCGIFGLNTDDFISFKFYKEESQWVEIIQADTPTVYNLEEDRRFKIYLSDEDFDTIERTVAFVVYNLISFKLGKDGYYNSEDDDNESFVALAAMYFGFGIFLANGNFLQSSRQQSMITNFPEQAMAYTNALLCHITGTDYEKVSKLLNTNTQSAFRQNYQYLQNTNDTTLDRATLNGYIRLKELNESIDIATKEKNFPAIIDAWEEVLKIKDQDYAAWNDLGYAKLMLGRFKEAIKDFNEALRINHFGSFSFDNKAFCKLQLGDLQAAYMDIIAAIEFGGSNSYTWRTLGIYHLLKQEYADAVENLEKAFEMDAQTDLIHFYLAKVYDAVGDTEKSGFHHQKSIDENETTEAFLKANTI